MPVRSVIDVDIDTTKLDAYQQKVEKLQRAARSIPRISLFPGAERAGARASQEHERAANAAERLTKAWATMRDHSREVIRNVREMAQRFLSISGWMTALTGLATAAGGLGLGALGNREAKLSNEAAGFGTTTGGLLATRRQLGMYVDVNSMFRRLRGLQIDPTQGGGKDWAAINQILTTAGQAPAGTEEDTTKVFQRLMPALVDQAQRMQADPRTRGQVGTVFKSLFGENFGQEEISRLLLQGGEIKEHTAQIGATRPGLEVTPDAERAYRDFVIKLGEAGDKITQLVTQKFGDTKFLAAINGLVDGLTNLAQVFVNNVLSADNIKWLTEGLAQLGTWLHNEDFQKDFDQFATYLRQAKNELKGWIDWLRPGGADKGGEGVSTKTGAELGAVAGFMLGLPFGVPLLGAAAGAGLGAANKDVIPDLTSKEGKATPGYSFVPGRGFIWSEPGKEPEIPQDEPLFKRKTPSSLFNPSAYSPENNPLGSLVRAVTALPVEIVGFRSAAAAEAAPKKDEPETRHPLFQFASYRPGQGFNIGANDNTLDLIERFESGGRNVFNYKHAADPTGFTASGYFQMIDETWRRAKQMAGLPADQWSHAIDAPYEAQRAAAAALLAREGITPWQTNEPLMRALQGQREPFHPMPPRDTRVTINNQAGSDFAVSTRQMSGTYGT
jgi:hypothetical protein